ncbi:aminotransferase class V-fold PLP-dependent enzyme [Raoultibacter phocaeensis]|uniref:aminotransferase class V-fold PLP-dependent enzyme n=1 Tax=Raoultibacter phocaeensis TaxID=2479841 RepID=UPI00111B1BAE|nr:SufS family cysteine desulfurase [Raoultibacter phocaeensis]
MDSCYYKDFPALGAFEGELGYTSNPLAYLDNAATTHKPSIVLQTVEGYYRECNANPYRGTYRTSVASTQLYEGSRSIVAHFIGADADEIVFTRNATESLNLVAYSYALDTLAPGDEIVLPISEHHSNLVVWQHVCEKTGAKLVYMRPDENGRLRDEEIEQKITGAAKIVACAHVSNVLGSVFPIEKIVEKAHSVGAVVVLDCAQSAAHLPLDLSALDVDFAAFSGHKLYAPMGIGVLFAKRELLGQMKPFLFGGEMIDEVREYRSTFENGPKRFEAGTPNVAGALGLATAIDYVQRIGFDEIGRVERQLATHLLDGMRAIDSVRIIGNPYATLDRTGVVAFTVDGAHPQDIALVLDGENIAIRTGSHCAQPLHRSLGLESSCRVSPCFYNTTAEIDRFLDTIESVRRTISRRIMAVFP